MTIVSWRWIFFIDMPIGLLAVVFALMMIVPDRERGGDEAPPPFGFIGILRLSTGLVGDMGAVELLRVLA